MTVSKTSRVAAILSAASVAIVIGIIACPGNHSPSHKKAKLVSVSVTPANPTLDLGSTQQFTATGIYSDGKISDVTALATWSSSDTASADVSTVFGSRGLATALAMGSTTISATYSGKIGSTTVVVSRSDLASIEVTPTNPQIAIGTNRQFAATAMFLDGTTQDLTANVAWESSAPGIATISNSAGSHGLAHSVGVGDTTIKATLGSKNGSTTLTVSNATLVSVDVTPTNPTIALNTSQQFAATGAFSDGTTQDLTDEVVWSSSAAAAQISNTAGTRGLANGVAVGSVTISATHSGITGSTTLTISNTTLASIAVTPALPEIGLGTTQNFTATGTFSDGAVQDLTDVVVWSSSDTAIATVSNVAGSKGVASSIAMGSTTISAALSGITGATTLTVTNATLASIDVTPSHPTATINTTQEFVATGTYTDSSTLDLTDEVTWTSQYPAIATVSNADGSRGLATTVSVGSTLVTATLDGKSGSTTLTVSPAVLVVIAVSPDAATLANGTSQAFAAAGLFSDGSKQDLTDQVTWSSTNDAIATVSNAAGSRGLVTGVAVGNVTISATFSGVTGTATVEVSSANLDSIDIVPYVPSIANGTQVQLWAMGNYSDGTTQDLTSQVTWSTSNSAVATISNAAGSQGLATGVSVGTATISATFSGTVESFDLAVTAATLASIQVTPVDTSIPIGIGTTFQATGTFSDASTQDLTQFVTWASSDSNVATISNAPGSEGFAQTVGSGVAQITATYSGTVGATSLTVTTATLVSIAVTPVNPSVPIGYSIALQAIGTYNDGSNRNLNSQVIWTSSNSSIAQISNSVGTEGRVTGLVEGTVALTATFPGGNGATVLTVTNETLSSIELLPDPVSIPLGGTQQMTAIGHFSSGSEVDITFEAKWLVTPRSVATIGNTTATKGSIATRRVGNTTIRATRWNKMGSAPLDVTAGP